RIGVGVEEVRLAREHRPDALLVRERDDADAALLDRRVVEVDADVEVAARLLEVEDVAEAVGVPAEARVARALRAPVVVHDEAVALALADAVAGARDLEDGLEARILEKLVEARAHDRREADALHEGRAAFAFAEDERHAEDLRLALRDEAA